MKRYKLGQRRTKTDFHGNSATMPDMIECDKGEYIKYSEYEQLLESIGAGGVSSARVNTIEGWKLVPIVPTKDMKRAFHRADDEWEECGDGTLSKPTHQWNAMLDAAPEQSQDKQPVNGDHIPDDSKMMEQDADKRDAERYRYLRDYRGHKATGVLLKGILFNGHESKARTDEVIDAAIKAKS